MTLLREPYHMVEIASVMDPITDQWSGLAATKDFWLWRRARPLPEWVPLSPMALSDLVRGWFMARLTGDAYAEADGVSLFLRTPNGALPFEKATVRPALPADQVGVVVEGLAVSFLQAYRVRNLKPLEPYQRLIALGGTFQDAKNPLTNWVRDGGTHEAVEYELLEADLSTAQSRRAAALSLIEAWLDSYTADLDHLDDIHQAQRHSSLS